MTEIEDLYTEGVASALEELADLLHQTSVEKGFYENFDRRVPATALAKLFLIGSEVAEMGEAVRLPEMPMSEKIPSYTLLEEEAADVLIRLLDFCAAYKLDIGGATFAKARHNETRPHKHGKKI